ncbi:MAG: DUF1343 domain-containing protein [Brumimicrobium sp.]|nr:DUF1343 domain-containing protein [Brumimicrobium sp.]
MYTLRLFLKSFFVFFLFSCNNHLPAQKDLDKTYTKENNYQIDVKNVKKNVPIQVGAEQLTTILDLVKDKKVAVVGNQTSRVERTHLVDTLLSLKVNIIKVFSPEHGFRGIADAGEKVSSDKDDKTGLPIISLYGNNKKPTAEQLKGIDILLFDLQDVGVRFYTYISTMHYVMEAAAENNVSVVILDRPNPNGSYMDGPIRQKGFESFIGVDPIPVVHGMTVGELAMMMNGERWLKDGVQCNLTVIPCLNYHRDMRYSLPVPPSPNLRSDESIKLYPSLCFFEGTVLSVGRGTETPFEIYGHPGLKGKDGYTYSFTPVASFGSKQPLLENQLCYGENLHDYANDNQIHQLELKWLINAYKALNMKNFFKPKTFDILAGTDELRKQIESGLSEEEIRASWKEGLEEFAKQREKYLLYK